MDIGVKERVIGAVVLVVLGIIIIPWVLQGPATDSTVTRNVPLPAASTSAAPAEYRMDLTGQSPHVPVNPAPQPVAQAAPQAQAPDVGASSTQAGTEKVQVPAGTAAAPKKILPVERNTPAPAASGGWLVQAGSYSSERNALKLQKSLEQHGYRVLISRYKAGSSTYYRVRIGPYSRRAAAEQAVPAINRIYGGKARVVPNS